MKKVESAKDKFLKGKKMPNYDANDSNHDTKCKTQNILLQKKGKNCKYTIKSALSSAY